MNNLIISNAIKIENSFDRKITSYYINSRYIVVLHDIIIQNELMFLKIFKEAKNV